MDDVSSGAFGDDRILPVTRAIAAVVIPFLAGAFVILYFMADRTGTLFAWEIKPNMTAAFMGGGYLAGVYIFGSTLFGNQWHRTSAAFPAISLFTVAMMAATLLHFERFDMGRAAAVVWVVLYAITPILVPWMWWNNQSTDPGVRKASDPPVPQVARTVMLTIAVVLVPIVTISFAYPPFLMRIWSWTLTPLTARVVAGWLGLMAVASFLLSRDERWSAWRTGVEAIAIWFSLLFIAAVVNRGEFPTGAALALTLAGLGITLAALASLYFAMLRHRPH
jgi:hypothetical protein